MVFFGLNTWLLVLLLAGILFGATATGLVLGRVMGARSQGLREPFGVLQGALVGFMGLVLAFGLSLAVGRDESRRADVVAEANAIGTTYLRAQTLAEPVRSESLALLRRYTANSITISDTVPGSAEQGRAIGDSGEYERRLWALAGQALDPVPVASASRLYVETLNDMFDAQSDRVYGLTNRVPTAVLVVEVAGATVALRRPGPSPGHVRPRGTDSAGRVAAGDDPARGHLRPRPAHPRPHPCPRDTGGRRELHHDRSTRRRRAHGSLTPTAASAQMRRLVDGQSVLDPEPDRRLHRQPRKVGRRNPRALAGLLQITARNAADRTGPEQQRELLADLAVR